ncbi:uncharacterized protein F58A4.6 [Diorhabda carinulata]|uniref:uncharacterized protein F58A4.6 n=1 Tax=Diorhabda carinulata TaxID=1163345 RepID=UPI0025A088C0|nr:uncharacterized protein F58A4.6 [Diorhabda carinulata]
MKNLYLYLTDGTYHYGVYVIKRNSISENGTNIPNNNTKQIEIDSTFWYYLYKELLLSYWYRFHFIYCWSINTNNNVIIYLSPTKYDLIDYKWNDRMYYLIRERCELDHTLSWLSTLGGAFSALGDYFPNCADTAGKISFHQLKLALRLGDPSIASRCRLYLSLSLIQKKKYKQARRIIEREYDYAKKFKEIDFRLMNMCKGIWSKLQYEYSVFKENKKYVE